MRGRWRANRDAALRERAEALAKDAQLEIQFLPGSRVRKEELARQRLEARGLAPGLACIFSAMENCRTFAPRKGGGPKGKPWLKAAGEAPGGGHSPGQIGRLLRRLREHGLVRRVARTFKYHLTQAGLCALSAAQKLRHHLIIPTLNVAS